MASDVLDRRLATKQFTRAIREVGIEPRTHHQCCVKTIFEFETSGRAHSIKSGLKSDEISGR